MKDSRLKQALCYQLNYFGWSSLYVYGIAIIAICVFSFFVNVSSDGGNGVNATGIGGVGFVHLLVVGIAGIRSDLRFFIQHGIGRRTTFFSNLYGSMICSVALGLFCEVFNIISHNWLDFTVYSSAYTVQSFLSNWLSYIVAFFFAWQIGALISLIYYRLGKMQQIVFSVTAIAIVVLGFSYSVRLLVGIDVGLGGLIQSLIENGNRFISLGVWVALILGSLATAGNYLLLRRVQIKE